MKFLVIIGCLIFYCSAQQIVINVEQDVKADNGCCCGGCSGGNVEPEPEGEPEPEPEPEAEPEPEPQPEPTGSGESNDDTPTGSGESGSGALVDCPTTAEWTLYQGYCYYHSEDPESWENAKGKCLSLGSNVGLYYPLNAGMQSSVDTEVLSGITMNHWVGVHDVGGSWETFDGQTPPIDPTGPVTGCSFYEKVGMGFMAHVEFKGADCTLSKGYLCGFEV